MDELILGMSNQVSQAMDEAVTSEVNKPKLPNFLIRAPKKIKFL